MDATAIVEGYAVFALSTWLVGLCTLRPRVWAGVAAGIVLAGCGLVLIGMGMLA